MKLQTKILSSVAIVVGIAALILATVAGIVIQSSVNNLSEEQLMSRVNGNLSLIRTLVTELTEEANSRGREYIRDLNEQGPGELRGREPVGKTTAPSLYVGNYKLTNNGEVVDVMGEVYGEGSIGTIFAWDDEVQDFVRVASSIKDPNTGERIVGTPLTQKNPAWESLRNGKPWTGIVLVAGREWLAAYQPIFDRNGKVVGASAATSSLAAAKKNIDEVFNQVKVGVTGYAFFVDTKTMTISSHREANYVGMKLTEYSKDLENLGESGLIEYANNGIKYIGAYGTFDQWNLKLLMVIPEDELHATSKKVLWIILGGLLVATIGIVCSLFVLLKRLVLNPLGGEPDYMKAELKYIANGDLHRTIQFTTTNSVGEYLATTQKTLRDLIERIKDSSTVLSSTSGELGVAADQLNEASRAQGDSTNSMAASMEELSVSISQVADSANDAKSGALISEQKTSESSHILQQVVASISDIAVKVKEVSASIQTLETKSKQIEQVVEVINGIASQTNLLALNAAIEAARAGEEGRGFSVVADEVRKLAEKTKESTEKISNTVQEIISSTSITSKQVDQAVVSVTRGTDLAQQVESAVREIESSISNISSSISIISDSLNEQRSASQIVASNVERIAQMTEETTASADQTKSLAQNLDTMSKQLSGIVDTFKVRL